MDTIKSSMPKNKFVAKYFPDLELSKDHRLYVASTFKDISSGIVVAFMFFTITEKIPNINQILLGLLTAISPWYTGLKLTSKK